MSCITYFSNHKVIDLEKPEEGIKELRYIDALKIKYVREQKKKGGANAIQYANNEIDTEWMLYVINELLESSSILLGDINQDSLINILDIVSLINFILDVNNPNEYEPPNSDVQGELDQVSGIRMKEQSLTFLFEQSDTDINNQSGIESKRAFAIKKSFSALPMDKKNRNSLC